MTLYTFALALKCTAAGLAVVLCRGRREHRAVAFLLCGSTLVELARLALIELVISPARAAIIASGLDPAAVPLAGWARMGCHLDAALFLTWPAGLAALAIWVYRKRRPWPVAVVYVLAVAAIVIGYPVTRNEVLQRCYLAAQLAALTVATGSFLQWFWREPPNVSQVIVSCILAIELGTLVAGPWRVNIFGAWSLAQVMYVALYGILILIQTGALWITPSPSE